jgi:hypothetical protein
VKFGPKRDVVRGDLRRIHTKELYALYSSPKLIWRIKPRRLGWAGHVVGMVESSYRILVGKPEGRRPLRRPRRRLHDNIKMEL